MRDKIFYIRIVGGMLAAIMLSQFCITVFFPTRSPYLRENIVAYLSQSTKSTFSQFMNLIPKFSVTPFSVFNTSSKQKTNSIDFSRSSQQNTISVVPEKSIVAAGIRQNLSTQKLVSTSPGIYVTTNTSSCLTVLKQNEAKWNEYNINVSGKTVKVRVPAGQEAPPVQILQSSN